MILLAMAHDYNKESVLGAFGAQWDRIEARIDKKEGLQ
jgi:hypothetical protein